MKFIYNTPPKENGYSKRRVCDFQSWQEPQDRRHIPGLEEILSAQDKSTGSFPWDPFIPQLKRNDLWTRKVVSTAIRDALPTNSETGESVLSTIAVLLVLEDFDTDAKPVVRPHRLQSLKWLANVLKLVEDEINQVIYNARKNLDELLHSLRAQSGSEVDYLGRIYMKHPDGFWCSKDPSTGMYHFMSSAREINELDGLFWRTRRREIL